MLEPKHLERGDNLRLPSLERVPQAAAALQFFQMVEADVAVERIAGRQQYEGAPLRRRDEW